MSKSLNSVRKRYADRQRRIRSERDAKRQCRTCGAPAVVSERTGALAKQCARHLGCDVGRKLIYPLAWETSTPLRQALEVRLEYPLGRLL